MRYRGGLVLLGLGFLVAACGASDVDRGSYVSRNVELLETFPTPPGSIAVSTASRPETFESYPFGGSYVTGYETNRSFLMPSGTKPSDLAAFYSGDVEGGRRNDWGRSFASGERSVCYRASLASICVRWLPNFDPSEQSGVPFQVGVNSEAYAHKDTWP